MKLSNQSASMAAIAAGFLLSLPVTCRAAAELRLAVIGRQSDNPVYTAVLAGARDAASEMGNRYGVTVTVTSHTSAIESSLEQSGAILNAIIRGVRGVILSCTEPVVLTPVIDATVESGVAVVTFESDAPKSKRLAAVLTDTEAIGRLLMQEFAETIDGIGKVAILANRPAKFPESNYIKGIEQAAEDYPLIKMAGVFNASSVSGTDVSVEIDAWILLNGWPSQEKLPWSLNPGIPTRIAVLGATPPLFERLRNGEAAFLLAPDYYEWGYQATALLVDFIYVGKPPTENIITVGHVMVTGETLEEYRGKWSQWLEESPEN